MRIRRGRASLGQIAKEERSLLLLLVPGEDPVSGNSDKAFFPAGQAFGQNAILRPSKPQIIPSARLLQLAAGHDTDPDHEAAD
jgi:hypothetical protein